MFPSRGTLRSGCSTVVSELILPFSSVTLPHSDRKRNVVMRVWESKIVSCSELHVLPSLIGYVLPL